jgi:endogenous inhibitor of DNA gyrase (YacG/DUF329 family)
MDDGEPTELLSVNCGRCGKPLKMPLEALLHKHTVDCSECEKKLPARVASTHGTTLPAAQRLESVDTVREQA